MPVSDAELAPTPPAATPPQGIVWLASYPKSGNTWTRAFLHNLLRLIEDPAAPEQNINEINEFTTWDLSIKRYERYIEGDVREAPREVIAAARPKVQADVAAEVEGLALVKTHHALVMDRGHPTLNFAVTSGAVYLVRNPLDVAVSLSHHMGGTIDDAIDHMASENLETGVGEKSVYEVYGSWSQHVRSWTGKPHRAIAVMRYEDMLENPEASFRALAAHLLLSPTAGQLAEAVRRSSFETLRRQEAAEGFREKPAAADTFFREGRAGQWRERLSRRQIRRIVQAHGEEMRRFGYLADDIAHLAPPPA